MAGKQKMKGKVMGFFAKNRLIQPSKLLFVCLQASFFTTQLIFVGWMAKKNPFAKNT